MAEPVYLAIDVDRILAGFKQEISTAWRSSLAEAMSKTVVEAAHDQLRSLRVIVSSVFADPATREEIRVAMREGFVAGVRAGAEEAGRAYGRKATKGQGAS